jgi:hypothetical protein
MSSSAVQRMSPMVQILNDPDRIITWLRETSAQPPVIGNCLRSSPLFLAQILGQELLDRLVNRTSRSSRLAGSCAIAHLLDAGPELLPCVGVVSRADAPVEGRCSLMLKSEAWPPCVHK